MGCLFRNLSNQQGEVGMQLKIRRSQKKTMLTKEAVFVLTVELELNEEEQALERKYQLRRESVYHNAEKNWHMTMGSLQSGEHLECKSLGEMCSVEREVREACDSLATYIRVANTFDGTEEVVEIGTVAA